MAGSFFYFGFGSNMLSKRIHIQNPGAVRVGPGQLQNYRLDFYGTSKTWQGAPATIVPSEGDCVYGAIWEIDSCHIKDLDNQESVHLGVYRPINVTVKLLTPESMECIQCRAYHLCCQPKTHLKNFTSEGVPHDRQPSETYLKTLVMGAIETGISENYINFLKSIQHNGNIVRALEEKLELQKFKFENKI